MRKGKSSPRKNQPAKQISGFDVDIGSPAKDSLRVDSEISRTNGTRGGPRELEKWVDDSSVVTPSLPKPSKNKKKGGQSGGSGGNWNQFAANEKFGYQSTYNENIYTIPLDKSQMKITEAEAIRLANEINNETTSNPHLAEERGQIDYREADADEEAKYSAVLRQPPQPTANGKAWSSPAQSLAVVSNRNQNEAASGSASTQPAQPSDRTKQWKEIRKELSNPPRRDKISPNNMWPKNSPSDSTWLAEKTQVHALDLSVGQPQFNQDVRREFSNFKRAKELAKSPTDRSFPDPAQSMSGSLASLSVLDRPQENATDRSEAQPTASNASQADSQNPQQAASQGPPAQPARGPQQSAAPPVKAPAPKNPPAPIVVTPKKGEVFPEEAQPKKKTELNPNAAVFTMNPNAAVFVPGKSTPPANPPTTQSVPSLSQQASQNVPTPDSSRSGTPKFGGKKGGNQNNRGQRRRAGGSRLQPQFAPGNKQFPPQMIPGGIEQSSPPQFGHPLPGMAPPYSGAQPPVFYPQQAMQGPMGRPDMMGYASPMPGRQIPQYANMPPMWAPAAMQGGYMPGPQFGIPQQTGPPFGGPHPPQLWVPDGSTFPARPGFFPQPQ